MLAETEDDYGAEVIDFSAARGMGDNSKNATDDYIQKRRQIWAARVPSAVKVIALAIIEHMSANKMECTASKARLAYMCNMPAKTFERHYNAAKELFYYHERKGKTTVFSPKLLDVAKELATLWRPDYSPKANSSRYAPSPKMTGGQNGPSPKMTLPQNGHTPPQFDLDTPPQIGGPKSPIRDQLEEKEDISPQQARPYSQAFEDFWKRYPRKEGKGKAYAAWKRLSGADRKVADAALGNQLPMLLEKLRSEKGNFCPHAATWLGQRRFDDEVGGASDAKEKPPGMSDLIWKKIQEDEARAKANGGIALW